MKPNLFIFFWFLCIFHCTVRWENSNRIAKPFNKICSYRSLPTRWRCNQFHKNWPKPKSDKTFSLKKPLVTPNFCKQNLTQMHCELWIFSLSKLLWFETVCLPSNCLEPENFESKKNHSLDAVHKRQISLQKLGVPKGFLK